MRRSEQYVLFNLEQFRGPVIYSAYFEYRWRVKKWAEVIPALLQVGFARLRTAKVSVSYSEGFV